MLFSSFLSLKLAFTLEIKFLNKYWNEWSIRKDTGGRMGVALTYFRVSLIPPKVESHICKCVRTTTMYMCDPVPPLPCAYAVYVDDVVNGPNSHCGIFGSLRLFVHYWILFVAAYYL